MSLEEKSNSLKNLVAQFDTGWFLGNLSSLMQRIAEHSDMDQLRNLSSPMRQLFYVAGLNVSSNPPQDPAIEYSDEEWSRIVELLNDIEDEYLKLFFPETDQAVSDEWKRIREVTVPSFLSYFNQGPLNYTEQVINWVEDLFTPVDQFIQDSTGCTVQEFLSFFNNLENFLQENFNGHMSSLGNLRPNWKNYLRTPLKLRDGMPDFFKKLMEEKENRVAVLRDYGIMFRFTPEEIVDNNLSIEKVTRIISLLGCERAESDYLFYTALKPGNPLYDMPIVSLGQNIYQVFEIRQVAIAIQTLLETICSGNQDAIDALVKRKGNLLEKNILLLFKELYKDSSVEFLEGYYVDGNEQDILILRDDVALIIEAKGYNLREPLRDPDRAFPRIKDDFNRSIGYAYDQCKRVRKKFLDKSIIEITDENGRIIKSLDTSKYTKAYSIIVDLISFGQVQNDLATLLNIEPWDIYPWVITLNDLEVFLKTLIANSADEKLLFEFLEFRNTLHGRLFCSDELEVSGGYLSGKFADERLRTGNIRTHPDFTSIYDDQYYKGMGFRNERHLDKKQRDDYLFMR